jgi:hypothetical protein
MESLEEEKKEESKSLLCRQQPSLENTWWLARKRARVIEGVRYQNRTHDASTVMYFALSKWGKIDIYTCR